MTFQTEKEFEEALISQLTQKGWEENIIKYPTETDLIKNWANILFENNCSKDRLGDYPLTDTEMQQILEKIKSCKTPLKLNGFINGKTVSIIRDNPDDKLHLGKTISLKIYDRHEIAAGQSRYQIVQQPDFGRKNKILNERRGDLILLINGMPVIHIELKKTGIPVSQACNQIEKYAKEGIFTGLFSLIQIFVAMNPDETLYFANPGPDGEFNKKFFFHWADFNNLPINNWQQIASSLLSIPMAHQMIGFYTVADDTEGILKVMRSYQYYAANAISDRVAKIKWGDDNKLGGYIWHTTGSGKTMTSFKSAQLIASSKNADKVIFLMDRIELGTQSLLEYRGFANEDQSVQATENTGILKTKLKSPDPENTLIVTSIQKMSNIKVEEGGLNTHDIELMNSKRIVFIVDECHRSTFGEMMMTIKDTFPNAIFFGFTGTPIFKENQKKLNETTDVFGDRLHKYTIADGIRDENVLGFDPYKVLTYRDIDVRRAIALEKAKASTEEEAISDPKKSEIYYKYMDSKQVSMAGYIDNSGNYITGIEDHLSNAQYEREEHQNLVVKDIIENWNRLSHNNKFHAIFATSSIPEAIEYYKLFKEQAPQLKISAMFDTNIDNNGTGLTKEDGLLEIIDDYNKKYKQDYSIPTFAKMKKDISLRLAHKKLYKHIENEPEKQLNLLIVVDQMLTGFDSKWVNTLYLDKVLKYENLIQAFSRTNRLFGPDKPFGTIKYYRKPHTMQRNIETAFKRYSDDSSDGLFVQHLKDNLNKMNILFDDIAKLFAGIPNFEKLPEDRATRAKFASLFKEWNLYIEAAKIQGFRWEKLFYEEFNISLNFDETIYSTLLQRYKELFTGGGSGGEDVPYDIEGYLTEIDTGVIDAAYMNSRFERYYKDLQQDKIDPNQLQETLNDLHKSFAMLSQEEQKYANIFLHDVQSGNIKIEQGKTFRDYITEYQSVAKNEQINKVTAIFDLDKNKLKELINAGVDESNINEFGRFDDLVESVDKVKAKEYFERIENITIPQFKVNIKVHNLLQEFILKNGIDIKE